jgi:hypothetical protein
MMIKTLPGYIIAGLAFIGIFFFGFYNADQLPYSPLWLTLCAILFPSGLYIIYSGRRKKVNTLSSENVNRRNKLLSTGERIQPDIDNCEIKENDYYEEMPDQRLVGIQSIDAVFDPSENYEEQYVDQSVIIYYHPVAGGTEKYVSQSFTIDSETLRFHIMNNDITLYVDRLNRQDYIFEFNNKLNPVA